MFYTFFENTMPTDIKALINKLKRKDPEPEDLSVYLSTGSTMVNLLCSNRVDGGLVPGHFYLFVGDSKSGKTFLGHTCLAEAANDPNFDEYDLIYDNVEDGALMDKEKFFGARAAKRIRSPRTDKQGEPIFSHTVEDLYYHLDDLAQAGKPFIFVEDSFDALYSEASAKKFRQQKNAARKEKGDDVKGSYGDGKAKKHSEFVRQIIPFLSKSRSILIGISQTRDNIGDFVPFGQEKTRSGGKALTFYNSCEIWSSVKRKLSVNVGGISYKQGHVSTFEVKKNRITGEENRADIIIAPSVGIDDTQSCVYYLVEVGHWDGDVSGKKVPWAEAPEFKHDGTVEKLVRRIEDSNQEQKLYDLVQKVWDDIRSKVALKRKKRYE